MKAGTDVDEYYILILAHELGHAFGLADLVTHPKRKSPDELPTTAGKQPSAVVSRAQGQVDDNVGKPEKEILNANTVPQTL